MIERIETSRLNRNLGEILDKIEAGHTIILTRYKKDVAVMAPPSLLMTVAGQPAAIAPSEAPPFTDAVADPAKPGRATVATQQAERDRILRESRSGPSGRS